MKKFLVILSLSLLWCNNTFAEKYYFKQCKINNVVTANYIINIEKNVIEAELKNVDGVVQNFFDEIKLIEKNKIVSQKIKSVQGEDLYYQYFLDSKTKTVEKLQYKKESGSDISLFNLFERRKSRCEYVKADWDKPKLDRAKLTKEQEQILMAQEQMKKEQETLVRCQGEDHKSWTNCEGIYKANTGHKYNGIFKDGKILKGIAIYPAGATYVGEFKDFEPHGYGTFVWKNGDKYYGEWKNGKNHGNGTKIWKNGRKYAGTFKEDKLHGQGTLFYPDGKKYEGGFINGYRHGEGKFMYPDGTAYIGKFIAGKEQGVGLCVNQDGEGVQCLGKKDTQGKNFSGKDTRDISIAAKKRVPLSQYEKNSKKGKKIMNQLNADFESQALKLCGSKDNYNILEKKIEILEIDETPSYGLETVVRLGIAGVVECKT